MGNTVQVTGYGQGATVIEDGSLVDTVSDVGFSSREADEVTERTMHGNLVYDMAEEEPHAELLPDPEVYDAARRIDEQRWIYRGAKRAFDIVFGAAILVSLDIKNFIHVLCRLTSPCVFACNPSTCQFSAITNVFVKNGGTC